MSPLRISIIVVLVHYAISLGSNIAFAQSSDDATRRMPGRNNTAAAPNADQSSVEADSIQFTGEALPPEESLSLWYRSPAKQWVEALAIGNGRLGAMVFGGVDSERLQLNEDTLWAGQPYDPANPEAPTALPRPVV